jgi:hemerythrin-like domain-containing protein
MLKILEALRPLIAHGEELPLGDWNDILGFLSVFIDRCHHGKEGEVLFPAMLQVADHQTRALIAKSLADHDEGRRLVATLASAVGADDVTAKEPQQGRSFDATSADKTIDRYVALLRPHVASEETHLFPVADRDLVPEVWMKAQDEYDRIEDEAIGVGQHEALEVTIERLTDLYLPRESRTHGFFD